MIQPRQTEQNEVVQFVCFETPLHGMAFTLIWKPFAGSYLSRGLRQIVLSEREDEISKGLSFKFISRNVWPAEEFARAFGQGNIGEGGGGPVHALQGGTFHIGKNTPEGARGEQDKIMGLFRLQNGVDSAGLSQSLTAAFSTDQAAALSLYHEAVVAPQQRFDLVAEIYCLQGQGKEVAARLEALVGGAIHKDESALGVYRETLALPTP